MWVLAALVFVGLGIWSATDQNWSGVIISAVLAVLSLVALLRRPRAA